MRWFQLELLTALAAWATTSVCATTPVSGSLGGKCPGDIGKLGEKLSKSAKIYFPGSDDFVKATTRWSVLGAPTINVVVVPGTEKDVSETVGPLLGIAWTCNNSFRSNMPTRRSSLSSLTTLPMEPSPLWLVWTTVSRST